MQPTDTGAAVGDLIGQVQDNARKLGLTWQLVKATVTEVTSTAEIMVIVDGDIVPVGAIPMIASVAGGRVWVAVVPPGGLYVVGQVAPPAARVGVSLRRAAVQALPDAAVTTVSWDTEDADTDGFWSSGTTVTIPAGMGGVYAISAMPDIDAVLAAGARGFVDLNITTSLAYSSVYRVAIDALGDRGLNTWVGPLEAGDTFTISVFADMAAASTMIAFLTCYRVSL